MKKYKLLGPDCQFYESNTPGILGGHWRGSQKVYGRLDCLSALGWIKRGYYIKYRVFFASEQDAIDAGFRPCGKCMRNKNDK
jgi:hypothetical protein